MVNCTLEEYGNAVSKWGMEKRIIASQRSMTVIWSNRGEIVAEKTEIMKRGKVVAVTYQCKEIKVS